MVDVDRDTEHEGRSRSFMPMVAAIATVLLVGGGIAAWNFSESGASQSSMTGVTGMTGEPALAEADAAIPMQLAGAPLISYIEGPEAIADVARLHGSTFAMTDAEIATYGEGLATIWRSGTPDAATAADQVERMRERIASGGTPFDAPHVVPRRPGVYATFGMGQEHFFFARGASVWWIAVVPSIAERALSELSGVST